MLWTDDNGLQSRIESEIIALFFSPKVGGAGPWGQEINLYHIVAWTRNRFRAILKKTFLHNNNMAVYNATGAESWGQRGKRKKGI